MNVTIDRSARTRRSRTSSPLQVLDGAAVQPTAAIVDMPANGGSYQPGTSLAPWGGPVIVGERLSMANLVHQRVRSAILNAQLLPGASISESDLATHLQVSRTPVREALQKLAAEGLVQVIPQVGTFVARLDL